MEENQIGNIISVYFQHRLNMRRFLNETMYETVYEWLACRMC